MDIGENLADLLGDIEWEHKEMDVPVSRKAATKSPQDKILDAVKQLWEKKTEAHWTESMTDEIPKSWEKHGDLILFEQHSFRSLDTLGK